MARSKSLPHLRIVLKPGGKTRRAFSAYYDKSGTRPFGFHPVGQAAMDSLKAARKLPIVGLFVGHHDRVFSGESEPDMNIEQYPMGLYRLVLMWSFFPFRTSSVAITMNSFTVDPES